MKRYGSIVGLAALLLTTACSGESVVGQWQSEDAIGTTRNTLTLGETGVGTATIYIMQVVNGQSQASAFEFDLEYVENADKADFYDLEMDCQESPWGECDKDDSFDMECRFFPDKLALRCDGDNNFRDYDALDWVQPGAP